MKKTIIISSIISFIIVITIALFFVLKVAIDRTYFVFCNDHINIPVFDITMDPRYEENKELYIAVMESIQRSSNATINDFLRDLERYEFIICENSEPYHRMVYMKAFNGVETNDWYWYVRGSWIKSFETITAREAYEFLRDPRNFAGEIIFPEVIYGELINEGFWPCIVQRDGVLYPLILVTRRYRFSDGRTRGIEVIVNTATGAHHSWDEFPSFDPAWPDALE